MSAQNQKMCPTCGNWTPEHVSFRAFEFRDDIRIVDGWKEAFADSDPGPERPGFRPFLTIHGYTVTRLRLLPNGALRVTMKPTA